MEVRVDGEPDWNWGGVGSAVMAPPFTVLDGEVFRANVDDSTTIDVIGVASIDRGRGLLTLRRVRTIRTSMLTRIDLLTNDNGRLLAILMEKNVIVLHVVDPVSGTTSVVWRHAIGKRFSEIFDADRFRRDVACVYEDLSAYRRRQRGSILVAEPSVRSVFPVRPASEELAEIVATFFGIYLRKAVKDGDGCILNIDVAGRFRLYSPELRLVRDFGRLLAEKYKLIVIFFDKKHGLLYFFTRNANTTQPNFGVLSFFDD